MLSHLCKYVRLWGPLWTHSAFGFESKNGKLKQLFHGRSDITSQLLFNADIHQTLQLLQPSLEHQETRQTMEFINSVSHNELRSTMTFITQHTYIVGQLHRMTPTTEQARVLGCSDTIQAFTRLFKDGVIYHSTNYAKIKGKRNNTTCCYHSTRDDTTHFGRIELFITLPTPTALIWELEPLSESLLQKGGHPCRSSLNIYQQVDILNNYIVPLKGVTPSTQLVRVPIEHILSKLVFITITSNDTPNEYVVKQPNNFERH